MQGETRPRARLIKVDVSEAAARLLVATSPDLPDFEIVGVDLEELEREVPACIKLLHRAEYGRDLDLVPVDARGTGATFAYLAQDRLVGPARREHAPA